ncbi:MAG: hypothetical protein NTZ80_04275 [Patescibacteria group bacterium]|nr:hypothetical protein [Patescibacteria group bacterium]
MELDRSPKEVFQETYQKLEQMITDLNLSSAENEKKFKHEAEFMRELADDIFVVMSKVASKVSGCADCPGCPMCPMEFGENDEDDG